MGSIPVAGAKQKGCHAASLLFDMRNVCESPFQVAKDASVWIAISQLDAELARLGSDSRWGCKHAERRTFSFAKGGFPTSRNA